MLLDYDQRKPAPLSAADPARTGQMRGRHGGNHRAPDACLNILSAEELASIPMEGTRPNTGHSARLLGGT